MCGDSFCSFHGQCTPTRLQGTPPFLLGSLCLSIRGEVCLQSQELGNTLRQCFSQGCSSSEGEKNRISLSQQQIWPLQPCLGDCYPDRCSLSPKGFSAQKTDPGDDILNFIFPFKCHLDLFFLSLTLLHTNCIQLQGLSENITLA